MKRIFRSGGLALLLLSSGCSTFGNHGNTERSITRPHDMVREQPESVQAASPMALRDRIAWPALHTLIPAAAEENLYTFAGEDLELRQALELFGEAYSLNIVIDEEIEGTVNVDFHDLPFSHAMSA